MIMFNNYYVPIYPTATIIINAEVIGYIIQIYSTREKKKYTIYLVNKIS